MSLMSLCRNVVNQVDLLKPLAVSKIVSFLRRRFWNNCSRGLSPTALTLCRFVLYDFIGEVNNRPNLYAHLQVFVYHLFFLIGVLNNRPRYIQLPKIANLKKLRVSVFFHNKRLPRFRCGIFFSNIFNNIYCHIQNVFS